MLKPRQMAPPLTARAADGRTLRAWDFKQRRNLVVAFLDAESDAARRWLERLAARSADLAARDATALVIFDRAVPAALADAGAAAVLLAGDPTGRSQRAWLDGARTGAFVADRYGELFACWAGRDESALPGIEEILSWLAQVEMACEECGAPHWPAED